jgi:hypothetical protein
MAKTLLSALGRGYLENCSLPLTYNDLGVGMREGKSFGGCNGKSLQDGKLAVLSAGRCLSFTSYTKPR